MKRKLLSVVAVLVLLGTVASMASAQGGIQALPGGNWTTGTQVQNVGDVNATIAMKVYDLTAGEWELSYTAVAPGSSVNFMASSFGWPDGSIGSAVVEADQPIVAQTNITNGTAAAQYQGVGTPEVEINFPLVKNNYKTSGKYTTFFVQNASPNPVIIYATYTSETGTTYDWNSGAAVEGYRMIVLEPSDVGFPTDKLGSLKVWATEPLAGVVNEHHVSETTILQATRGFGSADAATTLLIPTIKRQFNSRSTGAVIQNASAGAVDITITYQGAGINFVQYANGVPVGASVTFFENTEVCPAGATCSRTGTPLPVQTLASAIVTATGNVVGTTNETYYPSVPSGQRQRQTTTSCFALDLATTKIGAPLYKANHDYKNSGIQLQNTDTANVATYTATFSMGGSGGVPVTDYVLTGTIQPGQYVTLYKLYASLPPGSSWVGTGFPASWSTFSTSAERFGSVVITADYAIVANVNEADEDPVSDNRQDIKSYEAFNLQP